MPTLDDNGFILTESRAIALYLAEKNFPDGHKLYPKDVNQRARINQCLQFDCGTLYPRIRIIQVNEHPKYGCELSLMPLLIYLFRSGKFFITDQNQFRMKTAKISSRPSTYWINSWKAINILREVRNQHWPMWSVLFRSQMS